ncbi:hypothetical protein [Endozoicomonas sp. ALB091]|uniref:hypothetical protein n=1 Tax=Endozoicomonas sp. ALB091 TaxID=3403073 RepID=UPI003BB502DE
MNIGNLATGLAGLGLTAAVNLNYGLANCSPLVQWQGHCVMCLSATMGTSLSLLQCLQEGRNLSARTVATLATNACVLTYSCLKSLVDLKNSCLEDIIISRNLISLRCPPSFEMSLAIDWGEEK